MCSKKKQYFLKQGFPKIPHSSFPLFIQVKAILMLSMDDAVVARLEDSPPLGSPVISISTRMCGKENIDCAVLIAIS